MCSAVGATSAVKAASDDVRSQSSLAPDDGMSAKARAGIVSSTAGGPAFTGVMLSVIGQTVQLFARIERSVLADRAYPLTPIYTHLASIIIV